MDYEKFKKMYDWSRLLCDPVDYAQRQNKLIQFMAEYLIERDKPKEVHDDSDVPG